MYIKIIPKYDAAGEKDGYYIVNGSETRYAMTYNKALHVKSLMRAGQ